MRNTRSRRLRGFVMCSLDRCTKASLDDYLTLLSVAETCKYQGLDFLNFLRSEETDIDAFARRRRNYRGLYRI